MIKTKALKIELEKLEKNQPRDSLNMQRYQMPKPPPSYISDVTSWAECVDNANIQIIHQMIRKMNFELSEQLAKDDWVKYCDHLDLLVKKYSQMLLETKKNIQSINWKRKTVQEKAGEEITYLEQTWASQVIKNFELELQIAEMRENLAKWQFCYNLLFNEFFYCSNLRLEFKIELLIILKSLTLDIEDLNFFNRALISLFFNILA